MLGGNSFNRIEKSLEEDSNWNVNEENFWEKRNPDEGELRKRGQNLKPSGHSNPAQSYSEENIDDNEVILVNGSNESNSQTAISNILCEKESGSAREELHKKENNEVISGNDSLREKTCENVVYETKLADHEKNRENRDDVEEEYIFSPRTQDKIDLEKWSKGKEVSSFNEVRKCRSSFSSTFWAGHTTDSKNGNFLFSSHIVSMSDHVNFKAIFIIYISILFCPRTILVR